MGRIQDVLEAGEKILSIYCTAGYPEKNSTLTVLKAIEDSGAGMIELGMPYSDPLADGPVIQESSSRALASGMTIPLLFEQLKGLRKPIQQGGAEVSIPVILMGYLNPVLQYGFERFCADAAAAGIDGLILPDLPATEFEREYGPVIRNHGLSFSFLVTPETPDDRVRKLDGLSSGFIYAVSASSTTGKKQNGSDIENYLQRLSSMGLKNPLMVGFGIHNRESFRAACRYAQGAIIGTAFIKALENKADVKEATKSFISAILN